MPNSKEIVSILQYATKILKETTGNPSIEGYQSNSKDRVFKIVSAIFDAVKGLNIAYRMPPCSFEKTGQKVRFPDMIVKEKCATCLDSTLFFCAAIEEAGLKPILVSIKGHAFAGAWLLESESFNAATIYNLESLKKAVDSNKIFLFETTLCTDGKNASLVEAKECIDLDKIEKEKSFEYFVDVKVARDKGIKPLPEARVGDSLIPNDESSSGEEAPISDAKVEFEEELELPKEEPKEETYIDRLKLKLLDYSKLNSLLNFKDRTKTIELVFNNVPIFYDSLGDSKFEILPLNVDDPREISSKDRAVYAKKQFKSKKLITNLSEKLLAKNLFALNTSVKKDFDESGTNTLYLALGMLEWTEVDDKKKKFKAPILLVPVRLERESRLSGFTMQRLDSEAIVNETLLAFLKDTFDVDLSAIHSFIGKNGVDVDVAKVLKLVKDKIYNIDGWSLKNEVWLSQFSFDKYLQYKDLDENTDEILKNETVSALCNKTNPNENNVVSIQENELDYIVDHRQLFCPLSYDASQLSAIMLADRAASFVLSGPPGTGKSNTICNLITHFLAKEKRVLFVSEKRVALEVVHKQLVLLGLEKFCLELHSDKTGKKDVIKQFDLPEVKDIDTQEWDNLAKKLELSRDELNSYTSALHKVYTNGLTAYQAFGHLIQNKYLADSDALTLEGIDTLNHTKEDLDNQRGLCRRLSIALNTITKEQLKTFGFLKYADWAPRWQDTILACANELKNIAGELQVAYKKSLEAFGVSFDMESYSGMFLKYTQFLNYFKSAPALLSSFVANENFARLKSLVEEFISLANKKELSTQKLANFEMNALLSLDFNKLREKIDFSNMNLGSILKNMFYLGKIKRTLKNKKVDFNISDFDELEADVVDYSNNKTEINALIENNDILKEIYAKYNFNTALLAEHLEYACELNKYYSSLGLDEVSLKALQEKSADILKNEHKQLQDGGVYATEIANLNTLYNKYLAVHNEFEKLSNSTSANADMDFDVFKNATMIYNTLNANQDSLNAWCDFNKLCDLAKEISLHSVVESILQGNIQADDLVELFEAKYQKLFIYDLLDSEAKLARFRSESFENTINEFSALDDEYKKLTKKIVIDKLNSRLPDVNDSAYSEEFAILNREIVKQKGHMSVRKLLLAIPTLAKRMKPCFMMSPASVAKYLDINAEKFDLVIFDEASQIPVCEAVGAMGRGKQIVIVGDPQQLPPTSFFKRASSENDFDEQIDVIQDLDSILDETMALYSMPKHSLKYHYRSKHESLISFSNKHYYDNSLYTFPSVSALNKAVKLVKCNGVYDRGYTCVNKEEAKAIVEEIIRRVEDPLLKEKSIGVITFNKAQQELIETLLENERAKHPSLDEHLNSNSPNYMFIKNIENVQGDERDVILFSICFGADAEGNISMNFGPLNKDGGERRLNVAITRAREEIVIFSSLPSEKINLSTTRSKGVAHLKAYLEFAERGMDAFRSAITSSTFDDKDLVFEKEVADFLKSKEFNVHTKVGYSEYRIDIAILDDNGKYVVGIECDGTSYENTATARDRDILRKRVLEGLGWKMLRIWSNDWWKNREKSEAKLYDEIQEIVKSS